MQAGGLDLSVKNFGSYLGFLTICLSIIFSASVAYGQKESIGMSETITIQVIHTKNQTQSNTTSFGNATNPQSTQNLPAENVGIHNQLKRFYDTSSADSDNTFVVETERHLYNPGGEVKLSGTIWSGLIATVGGINDVLIKVTDSSENVTYSGMVGINANGQFQSNFKLPPDSKSDEYNIDVKADVNSDVLNSLTFKMQSGLYGTTKFIVAVPNSYIIETEGKKFHVNIATNSNVTNVKYDQPSKTISFIVQGETGTKGILDITIPKALVSGDFSVVMDGQEISHESAIMTSETQDAATIEINYNHNNHEIDIVGTSVVPEFPFSTMIMTLAIISSIIAITLSKRTLKRPC